jgi:hypothetical protein
MRRTRGLWMAVALAACIGAMGSGNVRRDGAAPRADDAAVSRDSVGVPAVEGRFPNRALSSR